MIYSNLYEVVVEFTKDYSQIRQALTKIEHFDKTCLYNVLYACNKQLSSNWGGQNYSQILLVTDVGIGLAKNSVKSLINNSGTISHEPQPLPLPFPSKISVMCLGIDDDTGFKYGNEYFIIKFFSYLQSIIYYSSRNEFVSTIIGYN